MKSPVLSCLSIVLAAAGVAAAADRPNILFAIADDASYPYLSAYGCEWVDTPAFDRVAREGLLFTRAYTPNAKCAPSRSCILTGRYSWQLKEAVNHNPAFPAEFKVYTEALADAGYHVGKTGKGWGPGSAVDESGKRRELAGQPYDRRQAKPPAGGISSNDYAANFADFLDANTDAAPWCFWYGGFEPHRRYEFGSGVAKGGKTTDQINRVPAFWPDNPTVRNDMLDYAYEVEHFDHHLGRMLEILDQRGQLDNTLVIVTADNGMPFPRIKGQEYELSNHLPMAAMWPEGIENPGRTVEEFVSFIDLAPTFIELAGLSWEATGMQPAAGQSLTDVFAGRVVKNRESVVIGKERHDVGRPGDVGYPIRGIISRNFLYLRNFEPDRWPAGNPETGYLNTDGSPTKTQILQLYRTELENRFWKLSFGKRPAEELYQIEIDPECLINLAEDPDYAYQKQAAEKELTAALTAQGDPRIRGEGEIFDRYPYVDKKTQGFYERYMRGEPVKAGWVNPSDFEPRDDSPAGEPAAAEPTLRGEDR